MMDISPTIVAKSDQLNADDLIDQTKTIRITRVDVKAGEQPVSIFYEGDNGKPYKPGLSMRRVLAHGWKKDVSVYAGRSMTLYRDPSIRFGGLAVGGIRISHMSDIAGSMTVALTETRGQKKAFTVKPLKADPPAPQQTQQQPRPAQVDAAVTARLVAKGDQAAEHGQEASDDFWGGLSDAERAAVKPEVKRWVARAKEVDAARAAPKHEKMEDADAP